MVDLDSFPFYGGLGKKEGGGVLRRAVDTPMHTMILHNQWKSGGWRTQLLSSPCPMATQDYPNANVSKL